MQTAVFDMLSDADRLCLWQTESDLRTCVDALS